MFTYEQATGRLFDPNGVVLCFGYAGGDKDLHPEGKNNPDMQQLHNIGPLPRGRYTFGELIEHHPHLGHYVFPLLPDPSNEMFGRAGFFMHGDSISQPGNASDGCIIVPLTVRQTCWQSTDHLLEVVRG